MNDKFKILLVINIMIVNIYIDVLHDDCQSSLFYCITYVSDVVILL